MGGVLYWVMSKVVNLINQVGSPMSSIFAILKVDIDHDRLKYRWGIECEVPGNKFWVFFRLLFCPARQLPRSKPC